MMSRTTSAIAHPAVPTQMTTWSFASSGGGGEGRAVGSRVSFIPSSPSLLFQPLQATTGPVTMMYLVHAIAAFCQPARPADEGNR